MKTCTTCKEAKELSEFGKNKRNRDTLMAMCRSCKKSKYLNNNRPPYTKAQKAKAKARYDKNKAEILAKQTIYRQENKENKAATGRKYRQENKAQVATTKKNYAQNNKAKINAYGMKRYAAKKQRTVVWADDSLIAVYYSQAQWLEETTGIKFHVDHIIPLQGELISGLHVETNLQILMAFDNLSKNNKYDVQQLYN